MSPGSERPRDLVVCVEGATAAECARLVGRTDPASPLTPPSHLLGSLQPWEAWARRLPARAMRRRGVSIDRAGLVCRPAWRGDRGELVRVGRGGPRGPADWTIVSIRELSGTAPQDRPRRVDATRALVAELVEELGGAVRVAALSALPERPADRTVAAWNWLVERLPRRMRLRVALHTARPHALRVVFDTAAAADAVDSCIRKDAALASVVDAERSHRTADALVLRARPAVALVPDARSVWDGSTAVLLADTGEAPGLRHARLDSWTRACCRRLAREAQEHALATLDGAVQAAPAPADFPDLLPLIERAPADESSARTPL